MQATDSRMQLRRTGKLAFLWADEVSGRIARLRSGNILVAPFLGDGSRTVPDGLIHHWIGAVFIPGATLGSLSAVIGDYGRYKYFFKPAVADSKLLTRADGDRRFSMVWQHQALFVHAAIEGQYRVRSFPVDEKRGYDIATTTQVREIEAFRQRTERLLAPGTGNGFVWRLQSIARYEERSGGVILEIEAIALSRDIPASLHWVVSPVVNHLSASALTTTLNQTRDAVCFMAPEKQCRIH